MQIEEVTLLGFTLAQRAACKIGSRNAKQCIAIIGHALDIGFNNMVTFGGGDISWTLFSMSSLHQSVSCFIQGIVQVSTYVLIK